MRTAHRSVERFFVLWNPQIATCRFDANHSSQRKSREREREREKSSLWALVECSEFASGNANFEFHSGSGRQSGNCNPIRSCEPAGFDKQSLQSHACRSFGQRQESVQPFRSIELPTEPLNSSRSMIELQSSSVQTVGRSFGRTVFQLHDAVSVSSGKVLEKV